MPLSVQNPAVKWVFEPAVMSRSGVVSFTYDFELEVNGESNIDQTLVPV